MSQISACIKDDSKEGFYSSLLPAIYDIYFLSKEFGEEHNSQGTGFCINKNGLVMTCAHLVDFQDMDNVHIMLRKKDTNGKETTMQAKFVKLFRKFDVCILQIIKSGRKAISCDFVTFAEKTKKIRVGADVYYIGGPHGLAFTFACGRISYPCKYSLSWAFLPSARLSTIERVLNDRVAVDLKTHYVVAKREPPPIGMPPLDSPFRVGATMDPEFSYLHEDAPLIYADISSGGGASGGPLFNNRGEVIGMLIGGSRFGSFIIHHNALQSFIDVED
ncbi:hypothetical protein OROMI_009660 [Orobanche minor]